MLEYYIVRFIFKNNTIYCLWYTDFNGADLFMTEYEKIVTFRSNAMLNEFINKSGLLISSAQNDYQLSAINDIINGKIVKYDILLSFWNIFQDISTSVGSIFLGNDNTFNELYDELFHASLNELNGENGTNDLNYEEIELLKLIFKDGKRLINKHIFSFD